MSDKKQISALFEKVLEQDPRAVMVVYTTRGGNITTMQMEGYEGRDAPMLSAYTRYRLDRMVMSYFSASGSQPSAPLMHAPKSNTSLPAGELPPVRKTTPVEKGVRKVLREAKKKNGRGNKN